MSKQPDAELILGLLGFTERTSAEVSALPYDDQLRLLRYHCDVNHGAAEEHVPADGWVT
jgi:hypothetical protein